MLGNYYKKKLGEKVARGVIVVDKEAGVTSHDEVDRLRRIFRMKKIGHSGTLDPKVTGVLVCGLGRGTRVLEYVLLSQKIYDCEIEFHKQVTQEEFQRVIQQFTGTITQLPPVKSSVKRVERERDIYALDIVSFAQDGRTARIQCSVERGTYIRKLCHDMGQVLRTEQGEVVGASMGELRRTQAGPFSLSNSRMITTQELRRLKRKSRLPLVGWWYTRKIIYYIDPIERVLGDFPQVQVDGRLAKVIASGADLFAPGVLRAENVSPGELVQVVDQDGIVLALGEALMSGEEMQEKDKGVAVAITKRLCG